MIYDELAAELHGHMKQLMKNNGKPSMKESFRGEQKILEYLLARKTERVLPGEISKTMNISSARTAAALNNLAKKGWVEREVDDADRRRTLVSLTAAGTEEIRVRSAQHQQLMVSFLEELGEHDSQEFVRIVGRIVEIDFKHP